MINFQNAYSKIGNVFEVTRNAYVLRLTSSDNFNGHFLMNLGNFWRIIGVKETTSNRSYSGITVHLANEINGVSIIISIEEFIEVFACDFSSSEESKKTVLSPRQAGDYRGLDVKFEAITDFNGNEVDQIRMFKDVKSAKLWLKANCGSGLIKIQSGTSKSTLFSYNSDYGFIRLKNINYEKTLDKYIRY